MSVLVSGFVFELEELALQSSLASLAWDLALALVLVFVLVLLSAFGLVVFDVEDSAVSSRLNFFQFTTFATSLSGYSPDVGIGLAVFLILAIDLSTFFFTFS